jgi:adenine-specific DNA-methyltransferase
LNSDSNIGELIKKIASYGKFNLTDEEMAQGIVSPQDSVNKKSKEALGDSVQIGDGIFVLSNDELKKIHLSTAELELMRPYYTTNQLGLYWGNSKNTQWIIYTDSSFQNPRSLDNFPHIKRHLDRFRDVITSSFRPYGLHRSRDEKFFKGEKIISLRKCLRPTFTYTDFDCYVSQTFNVIKTDRINLKYLCAILNSRLIAFWLKYSGKIQGDNFQVDSEPLRSLPIVHAKDQSNLAADTDSISLLYRILHQLTPNTDKYNDLKGQIERQQAKMDEAIYALYGLSAEEVKQIEAVKLPQEETR